MDIRAKHILNSIKKVPGLEQSIIAGGACRDQYFNINPKDYDYFVPNNYLVIDVLNKLIGSNGVKSEKNYKYSKALPIVTVINWNYEGLDIQVMISRYRNDEDFSENVMKSFDFGVNKIFYDGTPILNDTDEFQKDINNQTMTLYGLTNIKYLPKYVDRYNRISSKLPGKWEFKCPNLKLTTEVQDEVSEKGIKWKTKSWQEGDVGQFVAQEFPPVPQRVIHDLAFQIDAELLNNWVRNN